MIKLQQFHKMDFVKILGWNFFHQMIYPNLINNTMDENQIWFHIFMVQLHDIAYLCSLICEHFSCIVCRILAR